MLIFFQLYTYRTHKWVYGYRTHYDTERFNSTKAASIWEHIPLSIVTSEILGRFISVAIHEPENDDLYNTEYDEYRPEYVFSYSPGFAASYSIIKEACKSKFILVLFLSFSFKHFFAVF